MTITALPSAPLPTDNTATFNSKAFALVAALNTFVTQANAMEVAVDADAIAAAASAVTATNASTSSVAAANFKGAYSLLTGALAIPASVSHLSKVWVLTESVANVVAEVPGTSAKWLAVSVNFASPDAIGSTTPNSGKFTFAYSPEITLTDGATVSWNTALGQVAKVTLAGNRTIAAPTGLVTGAFYSLNIIQDATGSRTATWNAVFAFTGGAAPTLTTTAAAIDHIAFRYNGTKLLEVGRSLRIA